MDTVTKVVRSRIMASIRSVSKLELSSKEFCEARAGCRLRKSPGFRGPDWLNKKRKVAVFVHGCFWHGCPRHFRPPKTRALYWSRKIDANRRRDLRTLRLLRRYGWRVLVVWEHEVRKALR